jgi:hypothetical protein
MEERKPKSLGIEQFQRDQPTTWKQLQTYSRVKIGVGTHQKAGRSRRRTGSRAWVLVSEVAKFLRRDQANVSTMLSRLSAREPRYRL